MSLPMIEIECPRCKGGRLTVSYAPPVAAGKWEPPGPGGPEEVVKATCGCFHIGDCCMCTDTECGRDGGAFDDILRALADAVEGAGAATLDVAVRPFVVMARAVLDRGGSLGTPDNTLLCEGLTYGDLRALVEVTDG